MQMMNDTILCIFDYPLDSTVCLLLYVFIHWTALSTLEQVEPVFVQNCDTQFENIVSMFCDVQKSN